MTLPLYSEGEDRSRGDRAHRPAADRATQASPRASLYGESRPSVGTALRAALHDYRGAFIMLVFFALALAA